MRIAIIPARSGSKGIKNKNIKELCGKPMLAYTIEAAIQSGLFDIVHVSTDSGEYAKIAEDYGAEVPFLRSKALATDTSSTRDAILYTLNEYNKQGKTFDVLSILQPTSPLRDANDIKGAYTLYEDKNANAVISVCESEHSPLWAATLDDSLNMLSFAEKDKDLPRQLLEKYFRLNGAICFSDVAYYVKMSCLYMEKCYAYVMSQEHSIDIDHELDFDIAEMIMRKMLRE